MKLTHQQGDPRSLTLLTENARFMTHETFSRLVENIARYGVLQQWPLVWHNKETGERIVLSGNHRVEAAIQAGLDEVDWTETDTELTEDQRKAITLSHNSLVGEDDPSILKRMYESLVSVEEKLFSGLNDESLGLMSDVDTSSLAEANLDFTTMTFVFLPDEYERALAAFDDAKRMVSGDETWIAKDDQHMRMLDALEAARESAHVMNSATGLSLLLDVWEARRTDLRQNWLDGDYELLSNPKDTVPISSVTGHLVSAEEGSRAAKAIDKIIAQGKAKTPGEAFIHLVDHYESEKR